MKPVSTPLSVRARPSPLRLQCQGNVISGKPVVARMRSVTRMVRCKSTPEETPAQTADAPARTKVEGASTNVAVLYQRMGQLALPYWTDPIVGGSARWKLAGVVGLTLATTGVSVAFNFLGRDFFNALSEKNEELFGLQLIKYMGAFVVGIPVFVFKGYYQSTLALEWRAWLTERLMDDYFSGRTFYSLQAQATVDNPDQRISSDAAAFTGTALNLALVLLNAIIDLVSFSGILYSIYPPLFAALLAYSITGTGISVWLGKPLVGLNFAQEAREADLRYGLVRVRENAEAVAFYRGEEDEKTLLQERLKAAVSNYLGLLVASRNLDFFTSFYRYMIQLLPAAVVAPLFFQGKIEFGVINQSQSAFNHVLNDMSLVVYQFDSLAGFSAVIDRLGQFQEAMGKAKQPTSIATTVTDSTTSTATTTSTDSTTSTTGVVDVAHSLAAAGAPTSAEGGSHAVSTKSGVGAWPGVTVAYASANGNGTGDHRAWELEGNALMQLSSLSVVTPDGNSLLVRDLDLLLPQGASLLLMGPSGAGKTSILRTLAGLWAAGQGLVRIACSPTEAMFLPQRPYMVLGSLRDQVLYPTYAVAADKATEAMIAAESGGEELPFVKASTPGGSPFVKASTPGGTSSTSSTSGTSGTSGTMDSSMPAGSGKAPPSDEVIEDVLRTVRLGHLLSRYATPDGGSALDAQVDWSSSLSLGEQQRVAWARMLLARPRLALMDEATSALDQATEEELYKGLAKSGIAYVSVGHRETLKQFHTHVLQLSPQSSNGQPQANGPRQGTTPGSVANMTWELLPAKDAGKAMEMMQ